MSHAPISPPGSPENVEITSEGIHECRPFNYPSSTKRNAKKVKTSIRALNLDSVKACRKSPKVRYIKEAAVSLLLTEEESSEALGKELQTGTGQSH